MFNCAELLLEMFFFNQEHNVDYFLQSQPLFPQGDKFRLGCVHERKWDVQGEGKTEGGAQWYHGCGVGCQLWHAPMAFQRAFTWAPVTICLQWSGKQTYSTPSIFVMVSASRLMTMKCKSIVQFFIHIQLYIHL
jgi:hypothetical protein